MPVKVIIKSGASGPFFRASGKARPDCYVFERNPQRFDIHELVFPTAAAFNAASEDLLGGRGNPPMVVEVIPETAEADKALTEQLKALGTELEAKDKVIDDLRLELARAQEALEAAKKVTGGLSAEQQAMLEERDAMLEVLAPMAGAEETPLDVVKRLATPRAAAPLAPVESEPAEPQKPRGRAGRAKPPEKE